MLVSRFLINKNFNNKDKKYISEKFLNRKILKVLLLILTSLFLIFNLNKIQIESKFKYLNKILIENGFFIKNIEIVGAKNLKKDHIFDVISHHSDINIFNINIQDIYNEIKSNTWIKEASIEIIYPNSIKILLKEKEPVAIWQNKYGNKLITKDGDVILEENFDNFKNYLPIIIGKNAHKKIYSILKILNSNERLVKKIWSLTFVNERRWDIHFNQGLTIRLPKKNIKKAWDKIVFLDKNFDILNLSLTEIDLRNNNQILGKIDIDKKLIFKKKNS